MVIARPGGSLAFSYIVGGLRAGNAVLLSDSAVSSRDKLPVSRVAFCYSTDAIIPRRAADYIIAVRKHCDATASHRISTSGPNKTIRCTDRASAAAGSIAPSHSAKIISPSSTIDHVIAIGKRRNALASYEISIDCADKTI